MITKRELEEYEKAIFTGVTVGVGTLVLLFSTGATILVQCPFKCNINGHLEFGHGEDLKTSSLLFSFLNHSVTGISMLEGNTFKLVFSNENELDIIPELNGLESYVITTSHGEYPVVEC